MLEGYFDYVVSKVIGNSFSHRLNWVSDRIVHGFFHSFVNRLQLLTGFNCTL